MNDCCTDKSGAPKRQYISKHQAEEAAKHLRRERDVKVNLKIYPCKKKKGYWHLTSHNVPAGPPSQNLVAAREKTFYSKQNLSRNHNSIAQQLGLDRVGIRELKQKLRPD